MDIHDLKQARATVLLNILDRWAAGEWRHHGVSQAAFANLVGVRPTTVTRWKSYPDPERGKAIGDSNALRIEQALDLPPGSMVLPELAAREPRVASPEPAPQPPVPPGPAPDVHIALGTIAARLMTADQGTRELVAGMLASMAKNPENFSQVATGLRAILSSGHSDEQVEAMMPATRSLKERAKADHEGD